MSWATLAKEVDEGLSDYCACWESKPEGPCDTCKARLALRKLLAEWPYNQNEAPFGAAQRDAILAALPSMEESK